MKMLERLFYSGLILSFSYIFLILFWVSGDHPNGLAIAITPPLVLMTIIMLILVNLGHYDD